MSELGTDAVRPMSPLWPVRKVEKQPRDKREDEAQRQTPREDDEETPLVDTFA